jgi:hypothetical protein
MKKEIIMRKIAIIAPLGIAVILTVALSAGAQEILPRLEPPL